MENLAVVLACPAFRGQEFTKQESSVAYMEHRPNLLYAFVKGTAGISHKIHKTIFLQ